MYLYTDGDETGDCKDNFAQTLTDIYHAHKGDYQYLNAIYIDLNGSLPTDVAGAITNGDIPVCTGFPAPVVLAPDAIDLGNLTTEQEVVLHITSELPADQPHTATAKIVEPGTGLSVEPAAVTLKPDMSFLLRSDGSGAPGQHRATLRLAPDTSQAATCDYIFLNGGNVTLSYTILAPTPTPVPPTATLPPATATPAPTATAVPPTQTPTPTPSPTPVANISVEPNPPTSLGSVKAGSSKPLSGVTQLNVLFDEGARQRGSTVELRALLDGKEQPRQLWFETPDCDHVARCVVPSDTTQVQVGYAFNAKSDSTFFPGSDTRRASIEVSSANAAISAPTAKGDSAPRLDYTYTVNYPWSTWLKLLVLVLVLLVLLLFYARFRARFPRGSQATVANGGIYTLRRMSERGWRGRFVTRSLTVGNAGHDINVGAAGLVARLSPGKSRFSMFSNAVYLDALDPAILLDGGPITRRTKIFPGTTIATGANRMTL